MTAPLTQVPPARANTAAPGPWLHDVVTPWWREHIVDQLARDGTVSQPVAPARILYHVYLAVAELDRVLGHRPAP